MRHRLPDLLDSAVERDPDALAIIANDGVVSYGGLREHAGRVAALLADFGVERGDRVALVGGKTVEAIASIYGILEAGGIYVPLDPRWPARRLEWILHQCEPKFLIVDGAALPALAEMAQLNDGMGGILVNGDVAAGELPSHLKLPWLMPADLRAFTAAPATRRGTSEDVAYIIYTSGSTGGPKGVAVPHRAAVSWADWGGRVAAVGPADRIGSQVPLHFDISVFDIFVTAWAGASLAIVPDRISLLPWELAGFLERRAVTMMYWLPSTLVQVVLRGGLETRNLERLRVVFFAGEVFAAKHLARWMRAAPNAAFYNLYGSTEACASTYYRVPPSVRDDEPIPIGHPCDDMDVIAVSEAGDPIKEGGVGELLVRGPMVMKGYWRQPDLTRQTLRQNPRHDAYPDPVYRTGDLVTLRADGAFAFVGRKDTQVVKIRGFRVDLNEIEQVLLRHRAVMEAAVVVVRGSEGAERIRAAVVGDSAAVSEDGLLEVCRSVLPSYMVPASVSLREDLPRTATGKVDRSGVRALLERASGPTLKEPSRQGSEQP
jgi:amino acid adenylation domain-containing protein